MIGFSHGGGTVMSVTQNAFEAFQLGLLKGAINYYGPCRFLELHGKTPVLALNGGDNDWGGPPATCQQFAQYLKPDQHFQIHTYPGVVHGFDNPSLVKRSYNEGHAMQYDAGAAEDSFTRTRDFLDRWVRDAN